MYTARSFQMSQLDKIRKRLEFILEHLQYIIVSLAALALVYDFIGLFISESYAPPFMAFVFSIGLSMLVIPLLRLCCTDTIDGAIKEVNGWFFGVVFVANICVAAAAGIYYCGNAEQNFWTITDLSTGQVLQETKYPAWKFGYNATGPSEYHGPFKWDKTVSRQREMGGQICEIEWHLVLTCSPNHDNVLVLQGKPIENYVIDEKVDPYLPKVFEEAQKNQGNCASGNWIDVSPTFDPRSIAPEISWNVATFTCRYHFKPIV